jgi:hypothetical protein
VAIVFRVYGSTPAAPPGNPIDYTTIIATVTTAPWTWTGPTITAGTIARYAVRAYDTLSGIENPDIASEVSAAPLADGSDPLAKPPAPTSTSAAATLGGHAIISWSIAMVARSRWPTGFHIYAGVGTPSYTSPIATVPTRPYEGLSVTKYVATITGLTGGSTYAVAVRGYSAAGEGPSGPIALVVASTAGPLAIDGGFAVVTGRVDR